MPPRLRLVGVNILYIDREPSIRLVVMDMLAVAGERMIEAERLEAGVAILDEVDVQLLLVDLQLVGLEGLTVLRSRCARVHAGGVAIYALSAEISPDMRLRCIRFGADGLIHRPVAMDTLMGIVESVRRTSGRDTAIAATGRTG